MQHPSLFTQDTAFPLEGYSIGLTKREYFAAIAMAAIQKSRTQEFIAGLVGGRYCDYDIIARDAVALTDAMLEELNKKKE